MALEKKLIISQGQKFSYADDWASDDKFEGRG